MAEISTPQELETGPNTRRWQRSRISPESPLHKMPRFDAYLRAVDVDAIERNEHSFGRLDETTLLNVGPAHPSTHGVLRLQLLMAGEEVMGCAPVIGYLHTGIEKTAESLSYTQAATAVTRMDYASPLFNELVYALATEALLGTEVPERATWIRMLLCELNRISSHFLFIATGGFEIGAIGSMFYGWKRREEILRFFETVTGLRMNHNFIRPGGVAADLPDGWRTAVEDILEAVADSVEEFETLLIGQPMFRRRLQGVGVLSQEEALNLSVSGPTLRASGLPWDLRRDAPYLAYAEVEFDVLIGSYGDAFDRFAIRLNEVGESIKICRQVLDRMPGGDYRVDDAKVTPPPRARINESMEALIHHFKLFTEGTKVPEGEVYMAVESPRGELGCQLVADGSAKPVRLHVKGPSLANIQTLPFLVNGGTMADMVACISSVDPVMGEVDR